MFGRWVLISLLGAVLAIGGIVATAASLTINGVDSIGADSVSVSAPIGVQVTDISFTPRGDDVTKIGTVTITFDKVGGGNPTKYNIYVSVRRSDDSELAFLTKEPGFLSETIVTNLVLNGSASIPASDIAKVAITVTGPVP